VFINSLSVVVSLAWDPLLYAAVKELQELASLRKVELHLNGTSSLFLSGVQILLKLHSFYENKKGGERQKIAS
jgi:hypothetical protein